MTDKTDFPEIERFKFYTGQRLTASDLTELQRANRELRWLHNRSLHGWGIGIGLGLTGERGDTKVKVQPGYGVDCLGREIILTEPRTIKVPSDAGGPKGHESIYYLVIAHQSDEEQKVAKRRQGVCAPECTVRLTEEPRVDWRRPEKLSEGLELVLAQAWVRNCQLSRPLSLTVRRNARLSHQPYVAAGQTVAGATSWKLWIEGNGTVVVGVSTQVDTTAAHFRKTPWYSAHIAGNRVDGQGTLVDGFVELCDPNPAGFELRVRMPRNIKIGSSELNPDTIFNRLVSIGQPPGLVTLLNNLRWHVVWMGIEA